MAHDVKDGPSIDIDVESRGEKFPTLRVGKIQVGKGKFAATDAIYKAQEEGGAGNIALHQALAYPEKVKKIFRKKGVLYVFPNSQPHSGSVGCLAWENGVLVSGWISVYDESKEPLYIVYQD